MSATNDLLSNYQHVIDNLTLLTGDKGIFDVVVNGEMLFSKTSVGRHAEPGEVLNLFENLLGDDVPRYGT